MSRRLKGRVTMTDSERAWQLLENARKQGSVLGLSRVRELLHRMDDPQEKLRVIHISGTNGKGSFGAMLSSVLSAAGYTAGSFSSPAITSITDSFRIDGREVTENELSEVICSISPIWEDMEEKPTEFEVLTAAAFELFSRRKCSIVLMECGMGGDLDSTNVITSPLLSVITNVQRDHMGFLGNTAAEIASHKAGIIKKGRPVLFGGTDPDALRVIKDTAEKMSSKLTVTNWTGLSDISEGLNGCTFRFEGHGMLSIPLIGAYQPYNAANVLTAVDILRIEGLDIPESAVISGLATVRWHGRFEVLRREPLVIYDGSHNPDGIRCAADTIAALFPDSRPLLLVGVMADKEYSLYADMLGGLICGAYTVMPDNPRSLDSSALAESFSSKGIPAKAFPVLEDGVKAAYSYAKINKVPLIALGSLYMYREFTSALDNIQ